ncbi:MAG: efflux RND transporter permease subunit [Myxococcota bacterium]
MIAVLVLLVLAGLVVSPFPGSYGLYDSYDSAGPDDPYGSFGRLPRDPVVVDALPNVGENQQIVFTDWPGQSPRDVEDQVTFPLTTSLLGVAGVQTIRSTSMFGFSILFVVFEEDMGFYESRSRLLEKLSSLPPRLLPPQVTPTLGPDATPLGQVYWYTLVGRSPDGEIVGGWSLHELRSIQDYTVRYALQSVPGVSEVASVGGYVQEVQVDVDPDALEAANVTLMDVARAVRRSSSDAGLRTTEINRVEYILRSEGTANGVHDVGEAVVGLRDGVPLRVKDLAHVHLGPAQRRGALDDSGAEVVGGVVVVQEGANPLSVIRAVKSRVAELQESLPLKNLEDGTVSRVAILPFYDRSGLILETLGTLSGALFQQLLITILVVLVMLRRVAGALLISSLLPLGVLGAFLAMKVFGVDAHIMALSGIAIAIGTMVDMGIVLVENITARLQDRVEGESRLRTVSMAAAEVTPAVMTSTLTTILSFVPVFALTQEEGKMFRPLAFTKTFAVISALILAVLALPTLARLFLRPRAERSSNRAKNVVMTVLIVVVGVLLTGAWMPLGRGHAFFVNLGFVSVLLLILLGALHVFMHVYPQLLNACLRHGRLFSMVPAGVVAIGLLVAVGAPTLLGWIPAQMKGTRGAVLLFDAFPGLGREYMPPFDEGSYLVMPTTMPHASFGEALRLLQMMDARIAQIPEVDRVVGKLGRADTALDPAPISMFETVVTYVPEFGENRDGERVRQWRDSIRTPEDIWAEVRSAATMPGLTGAPRLQPIETRQVMLQSGMRSPLGMKLQGPSLEALEALGGQIEALLKEVPGIRSDTVFADRVVGKPYLEIHFDREALARHGLNIGDAQDFLRVAIGGEPLARTQDGRESYDIRVRHMSEERGSISQLRALRIDTPTGARIPLEAVADIRYIRGPQSIRAEDGFLTSTVVFDREAEISQSEVIARAQAAFEAAREEGRLDVPAGARWRFAGTWEAQQRSQERLLLLIPLTLLVVLMLLYLQFRSMQVALMIFAGVAVAFSGGFILLGAFGTEWFLAFEVFGEPMRRLFGVGPIQLSAAVWVGFIALVGIATDDGVVMATYLEQSFRRHPPSTAEEVRARTLEAGLRRVRPCLMTTATTFIALLPVVTSTGRGADLMRPMAVPILGGMAVEVLTLFVVPVLYATRARHRLRTSRR